MSLTPKENNLSLSKFEKMLKTNRVYFFDSMEFEEIIHYYLDFGKNNLAKKAINLGLSQHPNSVMLKLLYAELLIIEDEIEKASNLLVELQLLEPTNEEIYVQHAAIFSKRNEHEKALHFLRIALKYTDDKPDILSLMGMEYLYLDDFTKARKNFQKCIEEDIEDYAALYNVIYCFDMENLHNEAIVFLNKYINKDPYSEVAWHQIGRQHFILENYIEALRAFDYAVLIDEYFVGAYLEKAKTLEALKSFEEAIENYKITIELADPTSYAYLRIGECYEKLNNKKLAIKYYKKATHEDPLLDKGWFAIASLYYNYKNYKTALDFILHAIEIDSQNTNYWRLHALINIKLKDYRNAIESYTNCLHLKDFDLEIWIGLADNLVKLSNYEKALKTLQKSTKYFTNIPEIEYRLSGLYFNLSNTKKGIVHFKSALKYDYEYHLVLKELFPEIFKLQEVKMALKEFKKTSF